MIKTLLVLAVVFCGGIAGAVTDQSPALTAPQVKSLPPAQAASAVQSTIPVQISPSVQAAPPVPSWSPAAAPFWIPLLASFIGATIAFILVMCKDWLDRRRRMKSCWNAIQTEIEICSDMANKYLVPPIIQAPSYRWPTVAYQHVFPELLMNANLSVKEAGALLSYFIDVEATNRGLDIAQELNRNGKHVELNAQFETNVNRVYKHLHANGNWYGPAMDVIRKYGGKKSD